jgi:large subunit ribosomal protein L13
MNSLETKHISTQQIERRWFVLDAKNVPLGRLAVLAVQILRGKGKPTYSPHMDGGDAVVVINADKVLLTGNKRLQKIDFRASGYSGGQTYTKYGQLLDEKPERAVELAVTGMLPKNRLRSRYMRRLKVFRGGEIPANFKGAQVIDTTNPKIRSGGPCVLTKTKKETAE